MLARLVVAATVVIVLAFCSRREKTIGLRADQSQAIDHLLQREMNANQIPGLAVAIIRGGTVVKEFCVGLADVERRTPVTPSTPFQLASTTKSFVSTAVLLLVRDKRLTLDQSIGALLPGLPADWQRVTVRQLLSHTSGLPDIVRTPGQLDLIADSWEQAFPRIATAPHLFAPGERWAYTQTNYVLLSQIIERLSGQSLEHFLGSRLFQPLGMNDTFYAGGSRTCATNYSRGAVKRALDFPPFVHAAGGLCSSVSDLVRWNRALDGNQILPPELKRELWTTTRLANGSPVRIDGKRTGYGLGWVVDDTPGHKAVGHSGGNSSAYRRYLDDGFTVILLHNGVEDPDALVSSIASIVEGSPSGKVSAQERLWDAARTGDTAEIERALADGADVDALDTRSSRNGRRALNWAALNDRVEAVQVLLAHRATVNAVNKTGYTALHHAAEGGSLACAKALLSAGADPLLKTSSGERPADIARRKGHADVAAVIDSARSH